MVLKGIITYTHRNLERWAGVYTWTKGLTFDMRLNSKFNYFP